MSMHTAVVKPADQSLAAVRTPCANSPYKMYVQNMGLCVVDLDDPA